jgi:hypothetical protein
MGSLLLSVIRNLEPLIVDQTPHETPIKIKIEAEALNVNHEQRRASSAGSLSFECLFLYTSRDLKPEWHLIFGSRRNFIQMHIHVHIER